MEWQPIETAPRDGTYIILYSPKEISICAWKLWNKARLKYEEDQYTWLRYYGNSIFYYFWDEKSIKPTHWMPLPEPPKGS